MEVRSLRIPLILLGVAIIALIVASLRSSNGDQILATGTFHSVSHRGRGEVKIVRRGETNVLRIVDLRTYYRPNLSVVLIDASDAFENDTVKSAEKYVVGSLESVEGDMEYKLPDDLDLGRFNAVAIWSERYEVNFTTAPLRKLGSGGYE